MISGPILVQIIEAKDAVSYYREIMGSTNPDEAEEGTIESFMGLIFNVMQSWFR